MGRRRRIAIQAPLGFAAGVPLYLSGTTLSKWLADSGIDFESVALLSLVALPYNLKFLWAPLLDRYRLPLLGRRRGWIALFSIAVGVAVAVMSRREPSAELEALAVAALAVATLSASLDVVVDAYRTDVLTDDERGRGSATYVIAYRIAMLTSGAGALIAADHWGWQASYLGLAALLVIGAIGAVIAPPPPRTAPPATLRHAVLMPVVEFFSRPGAFWLIAIVALYRLGDAFVLPLLLPFFGELSFTNTEIGVIQNGMGMAATIVGVGIGGVIADRIGVVRALLWFGILQAAANAGYLMLATTEPTLIGFAAAVAIDNVCNGLGFAALVAFLMALCKRRFSATQYALLTSASSVLGRLLGAASGYIQVALGWASLLGLSIAIALPALLLIRVRWRELEAAVSEPERL